MEIGLVDAVVLVAIETVEAARPSRELIACYDSVIVRIKAVKKPRARATVSYGFARIVAEQTPAPLESASPAAPRGSKWRRRVFARTAPSSPARPLRRCIVGSHCASAVGAAWTAHARVFGSASVAVEAEARSVGTAPRTSAGSIIPALDSLARFAARPLTHQLAHAGLQALALLGRQIADDVANRIEDCGFNVFGAASFRGPLAPNFVWPQLARGRPARGCRFSAPRRVGCPLCRG